LDRKWRSKEGYIVYRTESFDSIWNQSNEKPLVTTVGGISTSITTYEDKNGLTSGAIYFYRVCSVDNSGGKTPLQSQPVI
jgi:hypothetical protein